MRLLAFILLLVAPFAQAEDKSLCTTRWNQIREAFGRYTEKKDQKAGEELIRLIPKNRKKLLTNCARYEEVLEALYTGYLTPPKPLLQGDDLAFRVAYRLIRISDGAFGEDLDIALGKTIEKYPEKFLKFLKAEHGDSFCPSGLTHNTGDYDVDEKTASAAMKKREKALKSVQNPELTKIKETCLKNFR